MMKLVVLFCKGRDAAGKDALEGPLLVNIRVTKYPESDLITVGPDGCPHNAGGHGQRCTASHPGQPKVGDGVPCPYSFDLPYALKQDPDWRPPANLVEAARQGQIKLLPTP